MKWFGTARWTYNKCLESVMKDKISPNSKELRSRWIKQDVLKEKAEWALKTPQLIRDAAMFEFISALEICKSVCKTKKVPFEMHFRKKKALSQTIDICGRDYGRTRGKFGKMLGKNMMESSEPLLDKINYTFKIQKKTPLNPS